MTERRHVSDSNSCLCLPYLWSVGYVLVLLHEPWPQGGRKALWERVAILACHNQVKGCAELRESESSISIHITQLPLKKMVEKVKNIWKT